VFRTGEPLSPETVKVVMKEICHERERSLGGIHQKRKPSEIIEALRRGEVPDVKDD